MSKVKLFDSLIHLSDISLVELLADMSLHNIEYAVVTDFIDLNKVSYLDYFNQVKEYECLIPIAYVDICLENIEETLYEISSIGYRGIKLHVRVAKTTLLNNNLNKILNKCSELNLVVYLCTYFYDNSNTFIDNTFGNLVQVITNNMNTKIVLLHGGAVEVLKYMELVRFNKNLLLDLSFTLCKYEGSSLDLDIQFLFKSFDRRICVGSDFPDFTLKKFRTRFETFATNISIEKQQNIAYKNLVKFMGI